MAQGSPAPNILPQNASAVVNCRALPGDDAETLLNHFRNTLHGLPVDLDPISLDEASRSRLRMLRRFGISRNLSKSSVRRRRRALPHDGKHRREKNMNAFQRNVYRFTPYVIDNSDLEKIHGTNECISVKNVNRCIDFFTALMERL
jgi:carboxypeptidase PM20D1